MKIAVISDTHGSLSLFEKALSVLGECDYIIHGGDVLYHGPRNPLPEGYQPKELAQKINSMSNIIFAKGNCDADVDQMVINHPIQNPYLLVQLGKHKILVNHGYQNDINQYIEQAKKFNVNIFIYGHTHKKELYRDDNLIVLNPGSTALPKDEVHSAAIITDDKIKLIDIMKNEVFKEIDL
ncbi:phosphodiesterase [Peptococcaceae bacterium 1198_IL3148]